MRISVVIPVYNVERFLAECIESVLAQTFRDFELLLIDDGSKDESGAICDRYAAQDARIRVFHIPNGGVSAARNLGLDHAQGEFVVFIDSDDWVYPEHLQQFAESGIGENGIVFTNLTEELRSGQHTRTYPIPDCCAEGSRDACMPILAQLLRIHCLGWTCNKMFSRATIEKHNLRFDPHFSYAEDEIFTAQYCAHIDHLVCHSRPTYFYRYVASSLLRGAKDPLKLMHTRQYIDEQYRQLGYSAEILYLSARTQFSRLRRELRRIKGWDNPLADQLTQGILDNWQYLRKYAPGFRQQFYDKKAYAIAWLACAPGSSMWTKLIIKGLHL